MITEMEVQPFDLGASRTIEKTQVNIRASGIITWHSNKF